MDGLTRACGSWRSESSQRRRSSASCFRANKSYSSFSTRIICSPVRLQRSHHSISHGTEGKLDEFGPLPLSPPEHGGNVEYEYTPSNPILDKYGQPQGESATPSRPPSTNVSSTSLRSDVFHSAGDNSRALTPALSRRPSGLAMTTTTTTTSKAPSSWFGNYWGWRSQSDPQEDTAGAGGTGPLRRVRSLAELQAKLEETQRELDSEDSISSGDDDDDGGDGEAGDGNETETRSEYANGGTGESGYPSTAQSRRSSRYSSRATSRATSRETSPARRRGGLEPLSTTTTSSSEATLLAEHAMQRMSPYNASNPHFGYPAVVPSSRIDPAGIPRPHHHKRKRDLVRTLTYLAALRFLALHRAIRYRLTIVFATVFKLTGLGLLRPSSSSRTVRGASCSSSSTTPPRRDEKEFEKTLKVHWTADTTGSGGGGGGASSLADASSSSAASPLASSSTTGMRSQALVDPLYFYFALLFVIARTPGRRDKVKRLVRFSAIELPRRALERSRVLALRALVGKEKAKLVLTTDRA